MSNGALPGSESIGDLEPDTPEAAGRPHKHITSAGSDWDFIADGAWWSRPAYQRAALLIFVAPLYRLRGYAFMAHQALSLRMPYWPYDPQVARARIDDRPREVRSRLARFFAPPGWIHEYPCDDQWPHRHDEEHPAGDSCSALPHGICWEHELDIGYTAGDSFDLRFDRTYRLNFPDALENEQTVGEPGATRGADKVALDSETTPTVAPGAPGDPSRGIADLHNGTN
jgi:hypothetical protein